MKSVSTLTALFFACAIFVCAVRLRPTASAETQADHTFPALQDPYVHPRVFVTASELPALEARLTSGTYADNITPVLRNKVVNQLQTTNFVGRLAAMTLDPNNITDTQINEGFFDYAEFDSHDWAVMALWGAIFTDGESNYVANAKETAITAAVNFGIIAEDIHERYQNDDYSGLSADTEAAIKSHWDQQSNYSFKLAHIRRSGSVGLAMAYDMLYNEMTTAQRDQVRTALQLATNGWNVWGGADTGAIGSDGNAVSNHYGYQGEQLVMLAAYYGETGWSQAEWDKLVQVITNYLIVGFNDDGYPIEDSYGPDLGLREGSRALIAMANNGINLFDTRRSQLIGIGQAMAHDIEAVDNGSLIGGESGGNYALGPSSTSGENANPLYPTFFIIWRYVFPDDGPIEYAYRWRLGDNYKRTYKSQSTVDYAFFGTELFPDRAASLYGMKLTKYFPERGKVVTRNEISNNAVQFAFDARPDAFAIGHDKSGRGHFSLNGLGRRWVTHLNFRDVRTSSESSTMHIGGAGQAYKAPSVKIVDQPYDDGVLMTASADLEYAYDWQWNEPWTFNSTASPRPDSSDPNWEHETIDPASFYLTGHAPDWLGSTLWDDENMGYPGMWMWKRPNLDVEKAYRSVAYARTTYPFVIIADDIKLDSDSHFYESLLQLPFDLNQTSTNGNDVILNAPGESERLLIRVIQAETTDAQPTYNNQAYTTSVTSMSARRFRVGVNAVEPKLKILLWPHTNGMTLPTTTWNADKSQLTVEVDNGAGGTDTVVIHVDESGGYAKFSNGNPPLAVGLTSAETTPQGSLTALFALLLIGTGGMAIWLKR